MRIQNSSKRKVLGGSFLPGILQPLIAEYWADTAHPVTDLLINGKFEALPAAPPFGWTESTCIGTREVGIKPDGSTGYIGRIAFDGASALGQLSNLSPTITAGNTYTAHGYLRGTAAADLNLTDGAAVVWTHAPSAAWVEVFYEGVWGGATLGLRSTALAAGEYIEAANWSLYSNTAIINGGFEGAAGPPPPPWVDWQCSTTRVAGTRPGGRGAYVGRASYDGVHATGLSGQVAACPINSVVNVDAWLRVDGASGTRPLLVNDGALFWAGSAVTGAWQHAVIENLVLPGPGPGVYFGSDTYAAGGWVECDDYVVTPQYVDLLEDQSGNGFDAVQTALARRPLLLRQGSPNGGPALRFDGVDDCLLSLLGGGIAQPFTIAWVGRLTSSAAQYNPIASDAAGALAQLIGAAGTTNLFAYAGGASFLLAPAWVDADPILIIACFDGANSFIGTNGGAVTIGAVAGGGLPQLTIGSYVGGGGPATIDVVGIVIIGRAITADEYTLLARYMTARGGL